MFTSAANVEELVTNFRIDETTFRYSSFVPRLYNFVKSQGFKPGRILPSRAFCSDENQGYPMPWIVTSPWPLLTAAQVNTQVEFDRTLRTVAHSPHFRNKCVFFISGLNIDISPQPGDPFPITRFAPWAAFHRDRKGGQRVIEQPELVALLRAQSKENPDQIDMDDAIAGMAGAESVNITTPSAA